MYQSSAGETARKFSISMYKFENAEIVDYPNKFFISSGSVFVQLRVKGYIQDSAEFVLDYGIKYEIARIYPLMKRSLQGITSWSLDKRGVQKVAFRDQFCSGRQITGFWVG